MTGLEINLTGIQAWLFRKDYIYEITGNKFTKNISGTDQKR